MGTWGRNTLHVSIFFSCWPSDAYDDLIATVPEKPTQENDVIAILPEKPLQETDLIAGRKCIVIIHEGWLSAEMLQLQ